MDGHWIWANEPTADGEAMIYGTPPVVEELNLEFDIGVPVEGDVPLIEIKRDADSQGVLTDNLIAAGVNGLVFSRRLREVLSHAGVGNIQYFPLVIRNPNDGSATDDYMVANIIGRISCLDRARSVLETDPDRPERIEFIESLAIDEARTYSLELFRLDEKSEIIVVSKRVKQACEQARITGVRFYAPVDFVF